MPGKHAPAPERFWAKVERRGPDECWPWIAKAVGQGYGRFTIRLGLQVTASRYAYELTHGPLPKGVRQVRHTCDNRPCCNPAHLILGTAYDNEHDKIERGRDRKAVGEANARAKLTSERVIEIRRRWAARESSQVAMAAEYGVDDATISAICRGRIWRHL